MLKLSSGRTINNKAKHKFPGHNIIYFYSTLDSRLKMTAADATSFSLDVKREFSLFEVFENILKERKVSLGERWRIHTGGQTMQTADKDIKDVTHPFSTHLKNYVVNVYPQNIEIIE